MPPCKQPLEGKRPLPSPISLWPDALPSFWLTGLQSVLQPGDLWLWVAHKVGTPWVLVEWIRPKKVREHGGRLESFFQRQENYINSRTLTQPSVDRKWLNLISSPCAVRWVHITGYWKGNINVQAEEVESGEVSHTCWLGVTCWLGATWGHLLNMADPQLEQVWILELPDYKYPLWTIRYINLYHVKLLKSEGCPLHLLHTH